MSSARTHRSGTLSPEFALLGFLLSGPSHGYDLHHRVVTELGEVWHLSQSQAYNILKRLEQQGDISAHRPASSDEHARRTLRITAAGRRRFLNWLEEGRATSLRAIRLEFLTRLYFATHSLPDSTMRVYAGQQAAVAESIRQLQERLASLLPSQPYDRLSLELRLRHLLLVREWLEQVAHQLHLIIAEVS